jgi:hypothetical protein
MTLMDPLSTIAATTTIRRPAYEMATLTHLQNLTDDDVFTTENVEHVLGFDPTTALGLDGCGNLSIRAYRHTHRPNPHAVHYWNRREGTPVPNTPVVLTLAMNTHESNNPELGFSQQFADSIVGVHFVLGAKSGQYHGWGYYNFHDLHDTRVRKPQCIIEVEAKGARFFVGTGFQIAEKLSGAKVTKQLTVKVGVKEFPTHLAHLRNVTLIEAGYRTNEAKFDFTFTTLEALSDRTLIRDPDSLMGLVWGLYVGDDGVPTLEPASLDGIAKLYKVVGPIANLIYKTHPLHYVAFRSWVAECKRSIDGIKISAVFNEAFKGVTTAEQMIAILDPMVTKREVIAAIKETAVWSSKRKTYLKNTTDRAFTKLMQDKDFLHLDRKEFPRLDAAIESGEIPISVFIRKEEQYFLLNGNFPLWEEMLKRHRDVTVELAKAAAPRQRFEKDLMSYFYFVLYGLPEYLKKHTKKKWTCSPKLVNSMTELDAPEGDDTGIARTRSALTPIVDNEKCHVIVPYASLRISGVQMQYCYSHDYHVLQRGFSFNGNVVLNDLEEKLNGKDDYGLMFYTLTGTEKAKGYPTFLIIFEKRVAGVHVHFHRTHPSRSKDGDYNPIHDWIKVCYNWMAGNVLRSTLKYQQGDLLFIPSEKGNIEGFAEGQIYDNHWFEEPVMIAPSTVKSKSSNVLGWVTLDKPTRLLHKEHDPVPMDAGTYEIRQCRSWEANPKGIWTLRID